MILEFDHGKLDVDIEKTKQFYETAEEITAGCSCDGCRNFMMAVPLFPQPVKDFFHALGVDLRKAAEIIAWCSEDDGNAIFYGGFYHICGTMPGGADCWKDHGEMKLHSLADGYEVGFTNDNSLLEKNFPAPVVQMEIFFHKVPWLLEQKNTY